MVVFLYLLKLNWIQRRRKSSSKITPFTTLTYCGMYQSEMQSSRSLNFKQKIFKSNIVFPTQLLELFPILSKNQCDLELVQSLNQKI